MKDLKEQVLGKVKTILLNIDELLARPIGIYKRDKHFSLYVYNKDDKNEIAFAFNVWILKKYSSGAGSSDLQKGPELEVNISELGNYNFELTKEEATELSYLFNCVYEASQPKLLALLTL